MMLCKVWERGEKNIICLIRRPWLYSLAFFAYAFVKNIIVTKIYIYLEALLFSVTSCVSQVLCHCSPCLFGWLLFRGTPWLIHLWPLESLTLLCDLLAVLVFWVDVLLSYTLGAGMASCHQCRAQGKCYFGRNRGSFWALQRHFEIEMKDMGSLQPRRESVSSLPRVTQQLPVSGWIQPWIHFS